MCGIVGFTGRDNAVTVVVDGLKCLEYRGYDSAGVAVVSETGLHILRRVGRVAELDSAIAAAPQPHATCAIGHTRWATHGKPSERNSHPHTDPHGLVAVVHNGIIENYRQLKSELAQAGNVFSSDTDTEVIAHLVAMYLEKGQENAPDAPRADALLAAVELAITRLDGSFAIGVVAASCPDCIVAARQSSPLVIARTDSAAILASDVAPIVPFTKDVIFLEDGQTALLTPGSLRVRAGGHDMEPVVTTVEWDVEAAERAGFPHFMLKEIFEQPVTLHRLVSELITDPGVNGDDASLEPSFNLAGPVLATDSLRTLSRVVLVAQGTAFHAAMVGRNLFERYARIPSVAELAGDFRYRDPVVDKSVLVIAVSQSGETADTLGAVRAARERGCPVLGIINVPGSSIARECDQVIPIHAGPEIGVASTKAFTGMIVALYVAAIRTGLARSVLSASEAKRRVADIMGTPQRLEAVLAKAGDVKRVAAKYKDARNFLFLGRGTGWPLVLEGALKLKEVSYIHAEGYNAGEMKHGPIALIDENMPVLVIALKGRRYEKIIGNIQEVKARGGRVIAIASEDDQVIASMADDVIRVRDDSGIMNSIFCAVPLQLLAYYIAVALGRDVDNPRNLAKSVTVE